MDGGGGQQAAGVACHVSICFTIDTIKSVCGMSGDQKL